MSSKVQFQTNIPVEVALAYDGGKQVEGNYGPQVMFSLAQAPNGETTMYVPPIVADRLAELKVVKGQLVQITKAEVKAGNRRSIQWRVARVDPNPQWQEPDGTPAGAAAGPQVAKPEGPAAPATPVGAPIQSTTNGNGVAGKPPVNGNGHAAALPPMQVQFGEALQEFLVLAGRASRNAEAQVGAEGASVRFDSRDIAATATSMFIEAARRGSVIWTPGGSR